MKASPAKKGDFFEFFAEIDLLCAISTCPGGDLSIPLWGPGRRADPIEVLPAARGRGVAARGRAPRRAGARPSRPATGATTGWRFRPPPLLRNADEEHGRAPLTLSEIRAARKRLGDLVVETPDAGAGAGARSPTTWTPTLRSPSSSSSSSTPARPSPGAR